MLPQKRVFFINKNKDESKNGKLFVIGKRSEGITIEFSDKNKMEIITKQRFREEAEILKNKRAKYYNHIQSFFGKRDVYSIKKDF